MNESQKPTIFTTQPDEIRGKHPHGQWVFDTAGLVVNFLTDVDPETNYPIVEPWARRLAEFLASDPAKEPYLRFESPHTYNVAYLHRAAAARIILTHAAWSEKVRPRPSGNGVKVVDADTGMPIIRKVN
jgi:hypothetical protein